MSAIELGPTSHDIFSTHHEDPVLLGGVLGETRPLAFESGIAQTEWGKIALWYALSLAQILRPDLRRPTSLTHSGVLEETGGPRHNPTRAIDTVGGNLMRQIMAQVRQPALVYIEEQRRWIAFHREVPGEEVRITVDPLDETGPIKVGLRVQTAAATITDQDGEFLSAAVTSLVDEELVLIEDNQLYHLSFNEQALSGGMPVLQRLPQTPRERRDLQKARIATLPRRMELLQGTPLFAGRFAPDLPTFGGYALLAMIRGDIDIMLDPFKGQPWYEAVHWGNMAERAGFIVSHPDGARIDFPGILRTAIRGQDPGRVRMVITTHQELHDQVLPALHLNLQEVSLNSSKVP